VCVLGACAVHNSCRQAQQVLPAIKYRTMGNVLSAAELPVGKVDRNYLQEPVGALIRTFGETYAPMGVKL
jgi:hypothetical protein